MTHTKNSRLEGWITPTLIKRMLLGAGIGLFLISLFLLTADHVDPAWGTYWWIRPLIIVPMAGAGGALFYHLFDPAEIRDGWKRFLVKLFCLLVFIIALWLGTVLGLDGTYWN